MHFFTGRNPQELLPHVLARLFKLGVRRESRNGPVLQLEGPTCICYEEPLERVVFWPERDANPFFHLMEALWMLAGRCDVEFVAHYAKRMRTFSDNSTTLHGAYGYRWRNHYEDDQLEVIATALRDNPDCRRQVLTMWDADEDLGRYSKDLPCNTHAYFQCDSAGRLNLTVCNRSNDVAWGALGANVVHMTVLLEYMAAKAALPIGRFYQFSANMHGYLNTLEPLRDLPAQGGLHGPYGITPMNPRRLFYGTLPDESMLAEFDADLELLDTKPLEVYKSPFFKFVVVPMQRAHTHYKGGNLEAALIAMDTVDAEDWRAAGIEWLERRQARRAAQRAQDDGVAYEQP